MIIAIRPEFLPLPPTPGELRLEARVETVEHLGAETLVELAVGEMRAVARAGRQKGLRPVTSITLGVGADKILASDAGTGARRRARAGIGSSPPPTPTDKHEELRHVHTG